MTQRAIVLFPHADEFARVEELRRRFDPLASMIRAHVTLVFPFASDVTDADLRAHVLESAAGFSPFSARFVGIEAADDDYVFLGVATGAEEIHTLHDRLYSGPLAPFLLPTVEYRPHVTVGRLADPRARARAIDTLRETVADFDGWIDAISVFGIDDQRSGHVIFTVPLVVPSR